MGLFFVVDFSCVYNSLKHGPSTSWWVSFMSSTFHVCIIRLSMVHFERICSPRKTYLPDDAANFSILFRWSRLMITDMIITRMKKATIGIATAKNIWK